jgi:hypothetical protein
LSIRRFPSSIFAILLYGVSASIDKTVASKPKTMENTGINVRPVNFVKWYRGIAGAVNGSIEDRPADDSRAVRDFGLHDS